MTVEKQYKCISFFSECIFFSGVNCKQPCNINCINQTCDRIDGSCLYGCKEGERCDKGIRFCIQLRTNTLITVATFYIYIMLLVKKKKISFTINFLDIENYPNSFSSSDNLPITVGSLVCACVLIIIGAGIIINVIR